MIYLYYRACKTKTRAGKKNRKRNKTINAQLCNAGQSQDNYNSLTSYYVLDNIRVIVNNALVR